jgi:pimeloyl-ACP methyl ester carboxylesterase
VGLNWRWNAPKIIMTNPAHSAAWMGFMAAQNKLAKGRTDGEGEATMAKLNQEREAAFQALATFDQFVFQIIPGKSIETAPKIFLSTFEIEGPIQEWPPKSHLALGLRESDAPNEETIRRIFSEFIPRAFRRPVDAEEVDAVVSNILSAQREFGLSHHDTLRYGLQALLVAPGFLMIQEPQQEKAARPLDNYELANRLSYFLWNSMPDAELIQLAAAGRLIEPAIRRQQVETIQAALAALGERPDMIEAMRRVGVPTLLIVGAEDQITPPACLEAAEHVIPNARLLIVPHAGHLVPLEAPEVFNRAVLEFLADVSQS